MLLRGRVASAAPLGGTHGTGSWGARPETRRARNCSPRGLPWGERPRDDPICGQRAAGRGRGRGTEPRVGAGRAAAPPTLAERRTTPCRRDPPAPAPARRARRAPIRRPAQPHSPVTLRGAGPTCPGAGLRRGRSAGGRCGGVAKDSPRAEPRRGAGLRAGPRRLHVGGPGVAEPAAATALQPPEIGGTAGVVGWRTRPAPPQPPPQARHAPLSLLRF